MASSEQVVRTGQCVRCLMCNQQIEVLDGNIKLAVSLHIENHEQLATRRENDCDTHCTLQSSEAPKLNFSSMACKENVEFKNNDDTLPVKKLHWMKHNQEASDRSEETRSSSSSKVLFTQNNKPFTIKRSQGVETADVKPSISGKDQSNSSVKKSDKKQYVPLSPTQELAMLDIMHNACLKHHLGFMQSDLDGMMFCRVCKVDVESTRSVSTHLKTKSHEYNVLTCLKKLVSKDNRCEFDFVSFCGSYLYCNLCKCKIYLCSKNLHATVVNILNHNVKKSHVQNKSGYVNSSSDLNLILRSLSQINPAFVDKHKHHVAVEMQPQVICKLCNKQIPCDKNLNKLFNNVKAHFTSEGHTKLVKSSSILKIYKELNIPGKKSHNLSLKGDNIHCFICNCDIESDLEKLQEHVQVVTSKQFGEKLNNEVPIYKQFCEALAVYGTRTQNPALVDKEELNVQSLLKTMPVQFRNVDYIVKKEPGKLSCLLCNCAMPFTHDHLLTHILGGRHRMNEEAKKQSDNKGTETPAVSVASSSMDTKVSMMTRSLNNLKRHDAIMTGHELVRSEDETHHFSLRLRTEVRPEEHKNILSKTNQSIYTINNHKKIKQRGTFPREGKEHDLSDFEDELKSSTNQVNPVLMNEPFLMKSEKDIIKTNKQGESHVHPVQKNCSHRDNNSADILIGCNSIVNGVISELNITNEIIKSNYKYISMAEGAEEGYYCSLCLTTIQQSCDSNVFLDNFLNHFTGQRHKENLSLVQSDIILELSCSNPIIEAEKKFFKVQNKNIICTLCVLSITKSFEKGSLEKILVQHIAGRNHTAKRKQEHMKHSEEPFLTILSRHAKLPNYFTNSLSNTSVQPTSDDISFSTQSPTLFPYEKPLKFHPHSLNQPKACDVHPSHRLVADSFKDLPDSVQQERRLFKNCWIE